MGWLSGWSYRKSFTLSRASGAVTNYQMVLAVGESSGATGESVDCGSLCKTDFSDLRITTSDGTTLLDYWIETVSGSTPNQLATIWIEFDSIGTGDTTFYLYYGNSGASAVTNGTDTFRLFEDFAWGDAGDNINLSGGSVTWTSVRGTPTIEVGTVNSVKIPYSNPSTYFTTPLTAGTDYEIYAKYYKVDISAGDWFIVHGDASKRVYLQLAGNEDVKCWNGSSYVDTTLNCLANQWGKISIYNLNWSAGTFDLSVDGNIKTGVAMDTSGWSNILAFGGASNSATAHHYLYDVIVRQRLTTEPTWGSWSSVEVESTVIEQEGFRPRNDDNNEASATWKADQDANITLEANTAFRLREILNATGNPASIDAQLEYRYKPSGGSFGSWTKVN